MFGNHKKDYPIRKRKLTAYERKVKWSCEAHMINSFAYFDKKPGPIVWTWQKASCKMVSKHATITLLESRISQHEKRRKSVLFGEITVRLFLTLSSKVSCCTSWSLFPIPIKAYGQMSYSDSPSLSMWRCFFCQPFPNKYKHGGGQKKLKTKTEMHKIKLRITLPRRNISPNCFVLFFLQAVLLFSFLSTVAFRIYYFHVRTNLRENWQQGRKLSKQSCLFI